MPQFVEACDLFKNVIDSAISTRASNFGSMEDEERPSHPEDLRVLDHPCAGVVEMEENLLSIAVNNFAVCSLHLRKIHAAVSKMEELVQDDPPRHMIDPVIFNLCTMYDLSFGPSVSTEKKKTIQIVAEK